MRVTIIIAIRLPIVKWFSFCGHAFLVTASFCALHASFGDLLLSCISFFVTFFSGLVLYTLRATFVSNLFLFCVLLYSACSIHAVPFYRCLGETTRGKGGSPAFPGLSPQDSGKLVLRGWSTQTIRKRKRALKKQSIQTHPENMDTKNSTTQYCMVLFVACNQTVSTRCARKRASTVISLESTMASPFTSALATCAAVIAGARVSSCAT